MRNVTLKFLLLLPLLVPLALPGQVDNVQFTREFGRNGIDLGKINSIMPDNKGAMWFSDETNARLLCLDGMNMTMSDHSAFYTVSEKNGHPNEGYQPLVNISTTQFDGKVRIRISDNGPGIPGHVMDEIFEPCFSTKPTGQGTGLGLSLAYEIVTKGHRGDLYVETAGGEGMDFIIELPIN